MSRRAIAPVPRLDARQKEVYAHLCRKLRFPLIYGHARGCYLACYDALMELHGGEHAHPLLAEPIQGKVSVKAAKLLHSLGVYSVQHLIDYDVIDFVADVQMSHGYTELVGVEIARLKGKYQKVARSMNGPCKAKAASTSGHEQPKPSGQKPA